MRLSRPKVLTFFIAIMVIGWMLYPRSLFLGYIYEGTTQLARTEALYLDFLSRNATDKFALERLSGVYDRMAEPQKATVLLKRLSEHRDKDPKSALAYLDHLERLGDEPVLYHARLDTARRFLRDKRFPRKRMLELLNGALEYARWRQYYDDTYAILNDLRAISPNPGAYDWDIEVLDLALHKSDIVLQRYRRRQLASPQDREARDDLVNALIAEKRFK